MSIPIHKFPSWEGLGVGFKSSDYDDFEYIFLDKFLDRKSLPFF